MVRTTFFAFYDFCFSLLHCWKEWMWFGRPLNTFTVLIKWNNMREVLAFQLFFFGLQFNSSLFKSLYSEALLPLWMAFIELILTNTECDSIGINNKKGKEKKTKSQTESTKTVFWHLPSSLAKIYVIFFDLQLCLSQISSLIGL